jgi:DNA polymerase III subunit chi
MPNIDFYLVNETPISACYRVACRLIDKAYQNQNQVFVLMNSKEEARALDDLLWTFRDDGFIPHDILEKNIPATVPVQLGYNITPEYHNDILLNLTNAVPTYFSQFKRILEIVPGDEASKKVCRQKFKIYKEKNCELKTHDLTKTT